MVIVIIDIIIAIMFHMLVLVTFSSFIKIAMSEPKLQRERWPVAVSFTYLRIYSEGTPQP